MARGGVALAQNVAVVANQSVVQWVGGRTSLVVLATTFPAACSLQLKAMDDATFIDVQAINANAVIPLDLPPGLYRIAMAGGAVAGFYASLVAVPYN